MSNVKKLPFSNSQIREIVKEYGTPFHLYDANGIIENAKKLKEYFSWNEGFKEYFAVKALPNPHILKLLKELDFGTDCSSLPELILSEKVGITGENISFTSNETPLKEYEKAKSLGAIINIDDFSHIEFIDRSIGLPALVSFRYNPGKERSGNTIIGNPTDAKYGVTKKQLFEGYKIARAKGVKRFGLHTMLASNELDYKYIVETANMLVDLTIEIYNKLEIKLEFINIGGGIGIPYKPQDKPFDLQTLSKEIEKIFIDKLDSIDFTDIKLFMESGRYITGPYGYLVTTAIHKKEIYKNYIGVDASMADLMRPGLYGAYHHITVIGKQKAKHDHIYDVVGSLCENNDKFAINRKLPKIDIGDLLVIHDTGAHGHAMGFNYNGKLRPKELLLMSDGSIKLIRRAETIDDYFATLNFTTL